MLDTVSFIGLFAMAAPGGEGGPSGLLGSPFFLIIMIFVMFYFVLYMPEKKRKKQREEMLNKIERGDEVITAGGIYGKVTAVTDKVLTVEIAPNVRIRVGRQHVTAVTGGKDGDDNGKKDAGRADKKSKKDKQ